MELLAIVALCYLAFEIIKWGFGEDKPKMKYIYLLWCHLEYGPECLKATEDRTKVVKMAESMDRDGWFERSKAPVISKLLERLSHSDEILAEGDGIHSLMNGWGGLHFQVVEVYND